MMNQMMLLLGILSGAGCAANVGTTLAVYVPKDAAATCTEHCSTIGLPLASVVIMANNVGCVCNAASAPVASGAAGGGMAALIMQENQRQSSQAQVPQSSPK